MRTRPGRRQADVLRAAAAGRANVWHHRQGRMNVAGVQEVYGDDVLDSLFNRGWVTRGAETGPTRYRLDLTDAGRAALAACGAE